MKRVVVFAFLAVVMAVGCGKSGAKPRGGNGGTGGAGEAGGQAASTASVVSERERLGAASLEGANPPPVVDAVITDGGTLINRSLADPDTLNPLTGRESFGSTVLGHVTDSMAERNPDTFAWEPRLAISWEASPDHLKYTFHLRQDVKWHDGAPFTSDDVVYSYQKLMDPKVDTPQLRNYYIDLKGVEAPDKYTVVFTWAKPYFKSFEMSAALPILARHVFDNGTDFNTSPAGRSPIGNGAYRFISWKTGEELVLERNEDYYRQRPHIKRIVYKITADNNAALLAASSGALDATGVRAEQWVNELNRPELKNNFNRYYYYYPNYSYIGWNLRKPLFTDKRVRQAMTMLMDRESVFKNITYGMGRIVSCPFYIFSPDYSQELKPWPFDPAAARKLLDEAGWIDHDRDGIRDKVINGKSVPFSFTIMFGAGMQTAEKLATIYQEDLRKSGIEMNLRRLEWSTFIQRVDEHDFDACILGWGLGIDDDPYQVWHSSQAERGSNSVGFKNAEVDRIIEAARVEFDREKRAAMYHRMNYILHEEQPYTFLFITPGLEIINKRFHNVIVHKTGLDIRDWYVPAELQ